METRRASKPISTCSGVGAAYYLLTEALHDSGGDVVGTTSVAVEITERKEAENQLRLLLRELTHRSKNLLAVIQAIARQTASRTKTIDDFLDRFGARADDHRAGGCVAGRIAEVTARHAGEGDIGPYIAPYLGIC